MLDTDADDPRNDFNPDEWEPIAALPNLDTGGWSDFEAVALVGGRHPLQPSVLSSDDNLAAYFSCFTNEFGAPIRPAAIVARRNADPDIRRNIDALTAFTAAVCAAAIISFRSGRIVHNQAFGVGFSEAFDLYPWFPSLADSSTVVTISPTGMGIHDVAELRPQRTPGVMPDSLAVWDLDAPLLEAFKACWIDSFINGNPDKHVALFRSLDMARAAMRSPGGIDATIHGIGRVSAFWISAFEILVHDGFANKRRVHDRLMHSKWLHRDLQEMTASISFGQNNVADTNLAGELLDALYNVRNTFLHGNPISEATTRFKGGDRSIDAFGAPLYRILLGATVLNDGESDDFEGLEAEEIFRIISQARERQIPQSLAEEAILSASPPAQSPETAV